MRANRGNTTQENTVVSEVEAETLPPVEVGDQADETTTETPTTETKRAARPALEVGEIVTRVSTRTDLKSRPSPTQNNPVFLTVKSAEFDTPTDILSDADKVENVKKILRRAAQPELLNVGMTIFPGHPVDEESGKLIVTFQKSKEKKVKGKPSDAAS